MPWLDTCEWCVHPPCDLEMVLNLLYQAAMSIFIYDWIITLPMELNLCAWLALNSEELD